LRIYSIVKQLLVSSRWTWHNNSQ